MDLKSKNNKITTQQRLHLIQMSERALAANPKNWDAAYNIGVLYGQEHQYDKAIEYFKKALTGNKKNETVLAMLAECLYNIGNYKDSAKYNRKLTEISPNSAQRWGDYAVMLSNAGKIMQAEKAFAKAERLAPNHPELMFQKANFLRAQGKYEEANAILQQIQEIEPGHSDSLYLYTHSRKFNAQEAAQYSSYVDQGLQKVEALQDISNLNYAGGKVWHDAGEPENAFKYYQQANDVRKDELDKNFTAPFEGTKSVFKRDFIDEKACYGDQTTAPIFILGMARSGTTLIESLCGAHSKITAGDEMIHLNKIVTSLGLQKSDAASFRKIMLQYTEADFRNMAADYMKSVEEFVVNGSHFTDKLPANFMNIGFIKTILPNAKIIHCRRHPIDNCLSIYTNSMRSHHTAYKTDLTQLGLYYRQYWQLMQHWREHIKGGFHEVYYEDVVANTQLNARNMIDYLNLDWEEGVLTRQGSQKTIKTLSAWQARQPIYKSSAGRWRAYEKHLGPLIDALGAVVPEYENELEALQAKEA
ncbi:MAG: sulfotransferase [Nitratireductor sp.]